MAVSVLLAELQKYNWTNYKPKSKLVTRFWYVRLNEKAAHEPGFKQRIEFIRLLTGWIHMNGEGKQFSPISPGSPEVLSVYLSVVRLWYKFSLKCVVLVAKILVVVPAADRHFQSVMRWWWYPILTRVHCVSDPNVCIFYKDVWQNGNTISICHAAFMLAHMKVKSVVVAVVILSRRVFLRFIMHMCLL